MPFNVRLPENTKVYVVVPDMQIEQIAHVFSPRLAHPDEQRRQAEARRAWWQQVCRLIGLSRFKLGLSVRKTRVLMAFQ